MLLILCYKNQSRPHRVSDNAAQPKHTEAEEYSEAIGSGSPTAENTTDSPTQNIDQASPVPSNGTLTHTTIHTEEDTPLTPELERKEQEGNEEKASIDNQSAQRTCASHSIEEAPNPGSLNKSLSDHSNSESQSEKSGESSEDNVFANPVTSQEGPSSLPSSAIAYHRSLSTPSDVAERPPPDSPKSKPMLGTTKAKPPLPAPAATTHTRRPRSSSTSVVASKVTRSSSGSYEKLEETDHSPPDGSKEISNSPHTVAGGKSVHFAENTSEGQEGISSVGQYTTATTDPHQSYKVASKKPRPKSAILCATVDESPEQRRRPSDIEKKRKINRRRSFPSTLPLLDMEDNAASTDEEI